MCTKLCTILYFNISAVSKLGPLCHNLHNACSCKTKILTKHRLTMSYQDAQFPLNRDKLTSQIWRVILIEILNARMPHCVAPPLPPDSGQWPIKVNDNSFVTSLAWFNNQSPLPSQTQHLMSSSGDLIVPQPKYEIKSTKFLKIFFSYLRFKSLSTEVKANQELKRAPSSFKSRARIKLICRG